MTEHEKNQIESAVKTIHSTVPRVLIADCYEGYELRQLQNALAFLQLLADKK